MKLDCSLAVLGSWLGEWACCPGERSTGLEIKQEEYGAGRIDRRVPKVGNILYNLPRYLNVSRRQQKESLPRTEEASSSHGHMPTCASYRSKPSEDSVGGLPACFVRSAEYNTVHTPYRCDIAKTSVVS